MFPLTKPKQS